MIKKPAPVNYLNNKDILKEINASKLTYCQISDEKYSNYDIIVNNIADINDTIITEARLNKSNKFNVCLFLLCFFLGPAEGGSIHTG